MSLLQLIGVTIGIAGFISIAALLILIWKKPDGRYPKWHNMEETLRQLGSGTKCSIRVMENHKEGGYKTILLKVFSREATAGNSHFSSVFYCIHPHTSPREVESGKRVVRRNGQEIYLEDFRW